MKKLIGKWGIGLIVCWAGLGHGDDTEIFFGDPADIDASPPYVMLSTELRPNAGSSTCNDIEDATCKDKLSVPLIGPAGNVIGIDESPWYAMRCIMDETWFFSAERTTPPGPETVPNDPSDGGDPTDDCNPSYTDVDFRELLIMALYHVFIEVDGVNVGFMVPHNDSGNNCNNNCSNGGYILSGFRYFEKGVNGEWDGNGNKSRLLNILKMLPSNQTLNEINANVNHPWQAKEMYLEFFRYLTGEAVLNASNGYRDFGTSGDFNIGECTDLFAGVAGALPDQYDPDGGAIVGWGAGGAVGSDLNTIFDAFGVPTQAALNCMFKDSQSPLEVNTGKLDASGNLELVQADAGADADDVAVSGNATEMIPLLAQADHTIIDGAGNYISPIGDNFSCSAIYAINATHAVVNADEDNQDEMALGLMAGGLALDDPEFEDVVRRMRTLDPADTDLGDISLADNDFVKSYFVVNTNGAENRANPWAVAGGTLGAYNVGDSIEEIVNVFGSIFDQITAVTSTFTAVSVPVNVQNRIQALNQIFLAVFVPDENGFPVWQGNLKKLKIEYDQVGSGITVVDANGNQAFSPATGRLDDEALTFWTRPNTRDIENNVVDPDTGEILILANRDGSAVNRGGAGQNIPGYDPGDTTDNVGISNTDVDCTPDCRKMYLGPETVAPPDRAALVPLDATFDLVNNALISDANIQSIIDADSLVSFFGVDGVDVGGILTSVDPDEQKAEAVSLAFKWLRGFDIFDEDGDGETGEVRDWIMGDLLHSGPLTVNYGETVAAINCIPGNAAYDPATRTCNPDVRVIFGTNNGFIHMIQSTIPGANGTESGKETWAFMPREMLANVQLWMTHEDFSINRPYGIDGELVSLTIDNNKNGIIETSRSNSSADCTNGDPDCDKVYLYTGLRRGGKSVYAIDVSNKDAPPGILWRIMKGDAGFDDLALTFSDPKPGFFRFEDVNGLNQYTDAGVTWNVPVGTVVFGGGYFGGPKTGKASPGTAAFDYSGYLGKDNLTACPAGEYVHSDDLCYTYDEEGNAVYMVHARTGELIWQVVRGNGAASPSKVEVADFDHSIAAPVSMVPSKNENGIIELFYVADTGGNIWRFDTPRAGLVAEQEDATFRTTHWTVTKIAELGLSGSDGVDRRFFASMDIARSEDELGEFLGLVVISGDRAHPKSESAVHNTAFMIKDRFLTPGDPDGDGDPATNLRTAISLDDLENVTSNCLTEADRNADGLCQVDPADNTGLMNGWYFDLGGDGEVAGEKGFTTPLIGFDAESGRPVVFFTTYVREDDGAVECANSLGYSRLYQVDFLSGAPSAHLSGETTDADFVREDRFEDLVDGIDGGVTAVTPSQGLTSSGRPLEIGAQRPIPKYWREPGVDILDKP